MAWRSRRRGQIEHDQPPKNPTVQYVNIYTFSMTKPSEDGSASRAVVTEADLDWPSIRHTRCNQVGQIPPISILPWDKCVRFSVVLCCQIEFTQMTLSNSLWVTATSATRRVGGWWGEREYQERMSGYWRRRFESLSDCIGISIRIQKRTALNLCFKIETNTKSSFP